MKGVGSSEDLLTQQSVNSHLPPFQRPVRSPGQDLIQLRRGWGGRHSDCRDALWTTTINIEMILHCKRKSDVFWGFTGALKELS